MLSLKKQIHFIKILFLFIICFSKGLCFDESQSSQQLPANSLKSPFLKELIFNCESLTEIGIESFAQTEQLLQILSEAPSSKKEYLSIHAKFGDENALNEIKQFSIDHKIDFTFWRVEDSYIEIEPTDCLILDSIKTYHHLSHELNVFSKNVNKYICIPHMIVNGVANEQEEPYQGNYAEYPTPPLDQSKSGVWAAIEDFLNNNQEWALEEPSEKYGDLAVLIRLEGTASEPRILHPLVNDFLKNKIILCTGPSLKRYDMLKEMVESECAMIPFKKIFISTNDPSILSISFSNKQQPVCASIKKYSHSLDCTNCIISTLKNVAADPDIDDDDIILFKHESVFLNDRGLFKRAINVLLNGYDAVVRGVVNASATDVFLIKVSAVRDMIDDFSLLSKFPRGAAGAEMFFHLQMLPKVPNVYTETIARKPHSNPDNYSHWKDTVLGFYHRCPAYLDPLSPGDYFKQKWWDKKDYNHLFKLSPLLPLQAEDHTAQKSEEEEQLPLFSSSNDNRDHLHVFIHVCTINHWRDILGAQLTRIEKSGLYDACTTISLGVLGNDDITPFLDQYPKLNLLFQNSSVIQYERATLSELLKCCLSKSKNTYVLYMHTKGVTKFKKNKRGIVDRREELVPSQNVIDWRLYMEYFLVDQWSDCIKCLKEEPSDVCGVNWTIEPEPHFSGNFWWARGDYIANLPQEIGPGYTDPEFWIGLNEPIVHCFHNSGLNHYRQPYPPSKYVSDPKKRQNLMN